MGKKLSESVRAGRALCRHFAKQMVPFVEKEAAKHPYSISRPKDIHIEEHFSDSKTSFWTTYMPGHNIRLSVRSRYVEGMENPWEFEYRRGLYLFRKGKGFQVEEVPDRSDDRMLIASELYPLISKYAAQLEFKSYFNISSHRATGDSSLILGGTFESKRFDEVMHLTKVVDSMIDLRLKCVDVQKNNDPSTRKNL